MKSSLRILAVLPILLTCAGCGGGSASSVRLNDGVKPGEEVFNSAGIPVFAARTIGRDVEELGTVCVSTQSEMSPNEYVSRIQREAAKIGADAVVGYEIMEGTATGIAVRYRDSRSSTR
jgi:uncharacterized protein YbjQ (UPF0145 family)